MREGVSPDPWAVDAGEFPHEGPVQERLRFALRYAIRAPSGHSTQP